MSQNISPQAAAAREQARSSDGTFGAQPHDKADGIDLGAQGRPVIDAEPDDPQELPFEIEGFDTNAGAWYDEDSDTTVGVVTIYPDYDHIMQLSPGSEDGTSDVEGDEEMCKEAGPILDRVIAERFPDTDDVSMDRAAFEFAAELPGRRTDEEIHGALWNDPEGVVPFANAADNGSWGTEHLSTQFAREINDSVIPRAGYDLDPGELDDLDGRLASFREHAEMGVPMDPPSDEEARQLAAMLTNEGKEIERIERGLPARYSALRAELQYAYADTEVKQYAVHALDRWSEQNNMDTVDRWQERWAREGG